LLQVPDAQKREQATHVIDTSVSLEETEQQVGCCVVLDAKAAGPQAAQSWAGGRKIAVVVPAIQKTVKYAPKKTSFRAHL